MTTGPVNSPTSDADRFLPADGLSLLGEYQGSDCAGRRFLVGRSDGQVIQLPLLLYLIMAAVAEGGVDGGWSADQVGAQVGAASGQRLTVDNVRYLIEGRLAPLGLVVADGADRPGEASAPAQPPRVNLLPGLTISGGPLRHWAAGAVGRVLSWPTVGRAELLLQRYRRRRWALALGGTAVLVSVAAAAPIMAGTGNPETGVTRSATAAAAASRSQAAAAASQSQAAAWVTQQVSPDVTVSCDPGMCRQLQRDGFPAARLKSLPNSARILPGSGVVIATSAIRSQLGLRLAAVYAPQVIASFGSGAARVDVRTIAPAGANSFTTQLEAEQTALASAGRQLLGNKNIRAATSAQAALRAGQVDARLLTILSLLSAQMPILLLGFTGAPGAGAGAPLRGAEIGVASSAARSAVVALLDAQQSPYRPAVAAVADGSHPAVALRFDAPASLNLSQP
jgi:hypothetical protein